MRMGIILLSVSRECVGFFVCLFLTRGGLDDRLFNQVSFNLIENFNLKSYCNEM